MLSYSSKQTIITLIKDGFIVDHIPQDTPINYVNRYSDNKFCIHYPFYGKLNLIDFLNRVFLLKELRSKDRRFSNAFEDINYHVNNGDYRGDWVYTDDRLNLLDDTNLVRFLMMIFREDVREDWAPWRMLFNKINTVLEQDRQKLVLSNNPVTGFEECTIQPLDLVSIPQPNLAKKNALELIGQGSFAKVFKYKDTFYNKIFALKQLNSKATSKEVQRFRDEFDYLNCFRCPYIVEVYAYQNEYNRYIMEYMDCTLETYLKNHNNYEGDSFAFKSQMQIRKSIINQITRGLSYIHKRNILHRDLSLNNVLINNYEDIVVVKLSDFGLIKLPNSNLTATNTKIKGYLNDRQGLEQKGFENYDLHDEIYALTNLFSLIITGKTELHSFPEYILDLLNRGRKHDLYNSFNDIENVRQAAIDVLDKRIAQYN